VSDHEEQIRAQWRRAKMAHADVWALWEEAGYDNNEPRFDRVDDLDAHTRAHGWPDYLVVSIKDPEDEFAEIDRLCQLVSDREVEAHDLKRTVSEQMINIACAKSALRQVYHSGLLDSHDYLKGEVKAGLRALGDS